MSSGTEFEEMKNGFTDLQQVTENPFVRISIDLFGPLPKSEAGNTYFVVATDYLTKWVEVKAIPKGNAQCDTNFLTDNILCHHGGSENFIIGPRNVFSLDDGLC